MFRCLAQAFRAQAYLGTSRAVDVPVERLTCTEQNLHIVHTIYMGKRGQNRDTEIRFVKRCCTTLDSALRFALEVRADEKIENPYPVELTIAKELLEDILDDEQYWTTELIPEGDDRLQQYTPITG